MGNLLGNKGQTAAIQEIRGTQQLPLLTVNVSQLSEQDARNQSFSILDYNILADEYVHFFSSSVPSQYLNFKYRSRIIMEELKKFSADIICLQEVDHYDDFYKIALENIGYNFLIYKQKTKKEDGCVIGIKTNMFEHIKHVILELDKGHEFSNSREFIRGNIAIVVTFRHKLSGKIVHIVNTHLFWDPRFEHVKYLQMSQILKHVNKTFHEDEILIWTGDFNSTPTSNVVRCIVENEFPQRQIMEYGSYEKLRTMKEIYRSLQFQLTRMKLNSAYLFYQKSDDDNSTSHPKYTNYTELSKDTVDYIFYTKKNLQVKRLLIIPTEEQIIDNALPNWRYPSDHLPLLVEFEFKNTANNKF